MSVEGFPPGTSPLTPSVERGPLSFDSGLSDTQGTIHAASIPEAQWPESIKLPGLFVNYLDNSVTLLVREGHEEEDVIALRPQLIRTVGELETARRWKGGCA